jgi:hypothetical protein
MVEFALIACCFIISSKFKKAGEKGASKYILGVLLALLGCMAVGILLFVVVSGAKNPGFIVTSMLIGYVVAITIAIMGIKKGNSLLRNITDTRVTNTERELEELKREMAGLKKTAPPSAKWTPTNLRLSSNRPLSSLLRIFIFTSGNGKTVLECPVALGTLSDTAGAPPKEILGKVSFDIISGTDIGKQIIQSGQFPDSACAAMNKIAPDDTAKAQIGLYRSTVRPFENPNTRESGVFILLYSS